MTPREALYYVCVALGPQPQTLRDEAGMVGEVAVFGKFNRLEIWNEERFLKKMNDNPLTEDDLEEISRQLGI